MPLSAESIIARACQMAHAPGYVAAGADLLNMVLGDLCETYDFALARGVFDFVFDPGLLSNYGSGPYALPADYLRTSGSSGSTGAQKSSIWFLQGVPYPMVPVDLAEFDMQVQQAGLQSYPWLWATDMSQSPPVGYAYPPPSGSYPVQIRYQRQMPDIPSAATSAVVPWFPNQAYLITRVAGEVMRITDDTRYEKFLGKGPEGAQGILERYLMLKDDDTNRSKTVQLDRRTFARQFSKLPNTKTIGW